MKWFRTGEVAKLFGWSRRKVTSMCEKGERFPGAELDVGGQWRIPEPDVSAYRKLRRELTARARRIAKERRDEGENKTP